MKLELYDKVRLRGFENSPRRISEVGKILGETVYWLEGGGIFCYREYDLELVEKWVDDGNGVELLC